MANRLSVTTILGHIDVLERELIRLKRDILRSLAVRENPKELKTSLFGSVKGGDVTEKMIKESKLNLFRNLNSI